MKCVKYRLAGEKVRYPPLLPSIVADEIGVENLARSRSTCSHPEICQTARRTRRKGVKKNVGSSNSTIISEELESSDQ